MKNIDQTFMKNWKNISLIEENAIKILKKGMEIIFKNISEKNIICIYLKGSFLRREMNKNSDVDVTVIVNNNKYLEILKNLQEEFGNSKKLNFGFSGYSIEELKIGIFSKLGQGNRSGTARFVRMIPNYKLIYGKELDLNDLYKRSNLEHLKIFIKTFNNLFFPYLEKGKLKIEDGIKQTLWLFELEVSIKNQNFKFTNWKNLLNYFDENHFIYKVMILRNLNKIEKEVKKEFIINLKQYLKNLNEEIN